MCVALLQEAKSGKSADAVKEVSSERDNLKAELSTLTKKVSDIEAQLQKTTKAKQSTDKELAAAKSELKVRQRQRK